MLHPIHQNGITLSDSEEKRLTISAKSQHEIVYNHFLKVGKEQTAEEVWKESLSHCPLTSVRRTITDMMKEGVLIKTEIKRRGMYGIDICTWKLASKQLNLFQ